jgi:hypothetical protein
MLPQPDERKRAPINNRMTVFALAEATDVEQVTELAQARARPLSFGYGTFRRLAEAS